ncbi:MAG: S8 family serine peptidase [Clostridium sp.]|jgi:subtilisin family serine protease|uniref:S8 family serine peptidase n=1 Tax=Clostridium sp. TaxID=1506 RepID=UPI0025C4DDAC|nr:S8 family serine peptidase [Clostridium sp.]MCH3965576.1 S8 family serine peptidase [Clostridium sp.]MCI1716904.1 S8 family serine peptidase [Clostridium sp.]MCI1801166.1 S8 family serine peptidase [Clostridium sp.]MCI1815090.1 S8 family serine peptidase [Clostridium sp.]MCI1871993.1 S8 family serine peptidase [Clostridium sp.]
MFSIKSKLEPSLKLALNKKYYKNYRIIIQCNSIMEKIEKKIKRSGCSVIRSIPYVNCICAIVSTHILDRLIEFPEVKYITWDIKATLCGKNVFSANRVGFSDKYKLTGKNICIALIDSGTYPHPDLISGKNRIKKFLDLINNLKYPYDDNGHGTFMSGIISGNGKLSNGTYCGIAENSSIYSIKAFNSIGYGYIGDILFGIQCAIEDSEDLNLKIICLPFEINSRDQFTLSLFQKLFDIAVKNNIAVITASGNSGSFEGSIQGISTLNNCITVGGIDTTSHNIELYEYSSCGPFCKIQKPDLVAACVDICSINSNTAYISEKGGKKLYPSALNEPYTCYTGTSCAAAYISGICSLLYENNPDLNFNDLVSLLRISCKFLNLPKWCQGSGMIDFEKFAL